MEHWSNPQELRRGLRSWDRNQILGFVPTMGALHEGHEALVRRARRDCDRVVVSIFVNPTQFDRPEDLAKYPSDLAADIKLLAAAGCDALFTSRADSLYPQDFSTWVVPEGSLVKELCGKTRGAHFRGVTTIVSKLFHLVQPERAYFGQKDYQQLAIIRRMVRDLDFPIEIISCPTLRESDNLAMSSRNRLLSPEDRAAAVVIPQSLAFASRQFKDGVRSASTLLEAIQTSLRAAGAKPDYVELVDGDSLERQDQADERSIIALAAFFGSVRLIDNHVLSQPFAQTTSRP